MASSPNASTDFGTDSSGFDPPPSTYAPCMSWERSAQSSYQKDSRDQQDFSSQRIRRSHHHHAPYDTRNEVADDQGLLVFGYSCKLFRDDKQALELERGELLVPWMDRKDILIDRYDVRLLVHDLSKLESGGHQSARTLAQRYQTISGDEEEDAKIESLCEEERWRELLELEKQQIEEDAHAEELRRFKAAIDEEGASHAEIAYTYESENVNQVSEPQKETGLKKIEPEADNFILPAGLNVPTSMKLPFTMTHHRIIEKTASFVASHGSQMEIVLKAKQANNPSFSFLQLDSDLHEYYKHIVDLIRQGKYTPSPESSVSDSMGAIKDDLNSKSFDDSDLSDSDGGDDYLHPSLRGNKGRPTVVAAQPSSSQVKYSPSLTLPNLPRSDTAYSQLVNSLRDKMIHTSSSSEPPDAQSDKTTSLKPSVKDTTNVDHLGRMKPAKQIISTLIADPPHELAAIIDKTAEYVALKGEEFETIFKKRDEERFQFLQPGHMYHAYYIKKKLRFLEAKQKVQIHNQMIESNTSTAKAISFSLTSASSTGMKERDRRPCSEIDPIQEELSVKKSEEKIGLNLDSTSQIENKSRPVVGNTGLADDALKDRLAQAARERLVRDKQEERRRKAALFVEMIRNKKSSDDPTATDVDAMDLDSKKYEDELTVASNSGLIQYGPELPEHLKPKSKVGALDASPLREELLDDILLVDHQPVIEAAKKKSLLPFVMSDKPLRKQQNSGDRSPERSPRDESPDIHRRHVHHRKRDHDRDEKDSSTSKRRSLHRTGHSSSSRKHKRRSRSRSRSRTRSNRKSKKSKRSRRRSRSRSRSFSSSSSTSSRSTSPSKTRSNRSRSRSPGSNATYPDSQ